MIGHGVSTHKCRIDEQTGTKNAMLETEYTWTPRDASVPCRVEHTGVRSVRSGDQRGQLYDTLCWFGFDPRMNEKNRVVFNEQIYDFVAVDNLMNLNRQWIVYLLCKTTQANLGRDINTNKKKLAVDG
jgi:hypothetical protein